MGLRGPNAKPIKKKNTDVISINGDESKPWEAEGLSRVERAIIFMESIPITSGMHAGKPFKVRPWQRKMIEEIFAESDGVRMVRTAVWSFPRKHGKTELAARLCLVFFAGTEAINRGQVYSAANDKKQASLIFNELVAMIEATPWLTERISIRRHSKELEDLGDTGSTFAALSADVSTKMGMNIHFFVYDELAQAANRDLYDALDTAMGAQAEPLGLVISTQAPDDNHPLSQLIDYGLMVKNGEIVDPHFHLTLFAANDDADPFDETIWFKVNPALGDFRSLEDVRRLASQAKAMPSKLPAFENLILNKRIRSEGAFIDYATWKACGDELRPVEGVECFAGLDIGGSRDLSALTIAFRQDDGTFDLLPIVWIPKNTLLEKAKTDRAPYEYWAKQGLIRLTNGSTTDPEAIARDVAELHGKYGFTSLAYDRWKMKDLQRELNKIGADVPLMEHGQGFRDMSPSINFIERLLIEKQIRHANHPLLTMAVSNATAEYDAAENVKVKKIAQYSRIDPFIAAIMAVGAALKHEKAPEFEPFCAVL